MRIIGVIDLLAGQAVHAQGGCRRAYRPVQIAADTPIDGDAAALARFYVDRCGLTDVYVADLDAIAGGAEQDAMIRSVVSTRARVWLDAGVSTPAKAEQALARGVSHIVIGLETLTSFEALRDIVAVVGPAAVFSLDLRDSHPITSDTRLKDLRVEAIAGQAVAAGVGAMIVLDVARVGSGRGLDWPLLERVRCATPGVTLLAGGGVRDPEDLQRLGALGCDGALVATALHGDKADRLLRACRPTIGH